VQADEVRARIQSVEPLDEAAAKMQRGLRVFLRDQEPLASVAKRLETMKNGGARNGGEGAAGEGEVSMVLLLHNGSEVEVKLPGRFKVSPQIAGAIKAVTGVVTVEAL
jgi:DNA polymerase-3 subunit alpha